ncbi:conserved hypothetical protein [Vibrio crassostreae]|uniref:Uncharacterized protein n=1 Tax=Vibrio crassostreae TaxID=246167 RepID=A0ABP1WP62_9VIBR|nr:hypothetical protein [Vibrio crassostreae]ROR77790.1 hypothetical protein EDB66_3961 [Vibrio crassostreae]TCL27471.1 hypothetical protein EDB52_10522 [Vibrio crassostreae]TCT48846.1 hypothetical protein EDB39_10623 [Vibrio crassostreae]TQL31225.1 hypothetical protein FB443_107181 [Vibrio crassostreae]CAK1691904.1 conserved hypothetical protein [Vibrio crassostreae]
MVFYASTVLFEQFLAIFNQIRLEERESISQTYVEKEGCINNKAPAMAEAYLVW